MPADTCVIVSFYDGRPDGELIKLLRQLRDVDAGADFELRVVVNSERGHVPRLPDDLASTPLAIRQNAGFNIGAWDHGWRNNPGFSRYLFLQDECELAKENWLLRYEQLLSGSVGLVGESLLQWPSWERFALEWPEATAECAALGQLHHIELGKSPTHVQTLVLGASAACLKATDGFLMADEKTRAIATEIMFSRHCLQHGFEIKQSAWRPFEYIHHPQWSGLRDDSAKLKWSISRALKNLRQP